MMPKRSGNKKNLPRVWVLYLFAGREAAHIHITRIWLVRAGHEAGLAGNWGAHRIISWSGRVARWKLGRLRRRPRNRWRRGRLFDVARSDAIPRPKSTGRWRRFKVRRVETYFWRVVVDG